MDFTLLLTDTTSLLLSTGPDKDKNTLPTKELAEAMLAMCQLLYLRDIYNDGWVPDWENESASEIYNYKLEKYSYAVCFFSYPDGIQKNPELRESISA